MKKITFKNTYECTHCKRKITGSVDKCPVCKNKIIKIEEQQPLLTILKRVKK
jgi:RNA polymerase subunit RPABC4/transcription elongation factor Spt4